MLNAEIQAGNGKKLRYGILKNPNVWMAFAGVVLIAVISILIPKFLTFENITNVLTQVSSVGLMGIGLVFVIITAGIDLALPTTMALSGILGCSVMAATQNVLLGVLATIAIGALIGAINGFSVAKLKMVPMIVTLAIATINSGISNWYTGAKSVAGMPAAFQQIFAGNIFSIPVQPIILILIAYIMHVLLSKTIFGRQLFQVGVNIQTAKVNGVKTDKILFMIYLISGIMAGIAGVLASAMLNAAGPSMGPQSAFLDIVAGVVLGGASVMGGKGTIVGTIIGCVFIAIISNVMNLLNVDFFITYIVKGAIIIVVTYIDVIRNRMAERK
jgi:ribose transport system permease protein